MKKGKIFILSGPSGSGKTTLYKKILAESNQLVKSVSVTTRAKRPGEVQGRDYFFVTPKMFEYKKRSDHFLESQKVFDNYYGTPRKYVEDLLKAGQNVLLCIDVKGAKVVMRKFPKAVSIFLKTPTIADLKKRLETRASEDAATMELRLQTALEELKEAPQYKYVVINDNVDIALKQLKEIIEQEIGK